MSASRTSRFRAAALAGVPVAAILLAVLTPAAQSDVTATRGNAYGVSAALGGSFLIAPQPLANGSGPPFDYSDINSLVGIGLPSTACPPNSLPLVNTAQACVIDVSVVGTSDPNPHFNDVTSRVTVADVIVGGGLLPPLLTLEGVVVNCTADGENVTSSVTIADGTLGGVPLATVGTISPGAGLAIPGVLTVLLNEEVERTEIPGTNRIIVNGARINLLGIAEVIVGHVECEATGPDVNEVTTTSSSSTSSSSTSSTSSTSTTLPGTTTTSTTRPGTTTTTAVGATTTSTAAATTTTTQPVAPTTTVTVPPSGTTLPVATTTTTRPPTAPPLARTGSNLLPLVGLGMLAIALGTLVRRSEQSFSPVAYSTPEPPAPPQPPEFRPVDTLPSAVRRRARRNPLDPAVSDALTAFDGQEPEDEQKE